MHEIPIIPLNTRVYEIRKGNNNLDEILAYQIDQEKGFISYTFQTKREIPKVLEIYREIKDEYYPAAFIIPSPSPEMNRKPIPFDDNFALAVGYSKEIPPYVSLNNLIRTYYIEIIKDEKEENKLLEMHVYGISGLDILHNREKPRKYILYLEKVANQEDLINLIIYNEKYPTSIGENEIMSDGWFIVIDDDTSKNNVFTPTDVKIFEIFI
jgi:hypothetical protein